MHRILLFSFAALAVSLGDAASYQLKSGVVIDPILDTSSNVHSYTGNNLGPSTYLSYATLSYAYLNHVDLNGATLIGANLSHANLHFADVSDADLTGADLSDALLSDGSLAGANLTNAYFYNTNLSYVDFTGATLTGADLTYANLYDANLSNVDLSGSTLNVNNYNLAVWSDAYYYTDNEPIWESGMNAAWRLSEGILAIDPANSVPEPSAILLAFLVLPLRARRRR